MIQLFRTPSEAVAPSGEDGQGEAGSTMEKAKLDRRLAGPLLLVILLVACSSEPMNPSPESRFLQDRLIPRIIEWTKTDSELLALGPMLAPQGFEKICTVAQYARIAEFESEVPGIRSTHGSVGIAVPESRIAIVGIKGDAAHVAYVKMIDVTLRNKRPSCSGIEKAVVRRLPDQHPEWPGNIPDVRLEETE